MTQRQLHYQGPPHESLQKLRNWSTIHSLQAAQQVAKCPFVVTGLKVTARLVSVSCRQLFFEAWHL